MASKIRNLECILILFLGLSLSSESRSSFKRICYYASTDQADKDLPVKSINGTLCTHLIIGFAVVINKTITPMRLNDTIVYTDAVKLKRFYPHLKVMLSIGGGGAEAGFHEAVNDRVSRVSFANSVHDMVTNYGFDGVDIDWEFPGWSKHDQDKDNFVHMLRELRKVFEDRRSIDNHRKEHLILSVAVAAQLTIIDISYDIPNIVKYVDFINLMSYDYHDYSVYTPFIEFNAPLYARSSELGYLATLNTNWSAFYWVSQGTPKEKLMIGIPTYSHNYILADKDLWTPGSPSIGDSVEFTYSDVCDFLSDPLTAYRYDGEAGVPYASKGYLWSSFEDRYSMRRKVEFIKNNNFGGAMTYNLNCDDHKMVCSSTRFPLQTIVYEVLEKCIKDHNEMPNDVPGLVRG